MIDDSVQDNTDTPPDDALQAAWNTFSAARDAREARIQALTDEGLPLDGAA